jgi:hypothetical protein
LLPAVDVRQNDAVLLEGVEVEMARPVLAAVQEQQKTIDALRASVAKQDLALAFLARLAGVSEHIDAINKQADVLNPAQPWPDPPSAGPSETTDQARTPSAQDDPRAQGVTPGSNQGIAADSTDVALAPGQSLPTAPYGDLQDVSAPVAGTETHVPNDLTRIETDVRVGDPTDPEVAFPWTLGGENPQAEDAVSDAQSAVQRAASSSNRTMASLHLARLRLAAKVASGDDLQIAAAIDGDSSLSDHDISREIEVLSSVTKAAARQARPANLVPKSASVQRTVPSLAGDSGISSVASAASVSDDVADSDLFD